jgi:hypothetical protein
MQRRDFLRMLGVGAAAASVPVVLVPERRIWQVPRNAPVATRVRSVRDMEQHAGFLVTDADYTQRIVDFAAAKREREGVDRLDCEWPLQRGVC